MKKSGNPHRRKKGHQDNSLEAMWIRQGGRCYLCRRATVLGGRGPLAATKEHVVARANGGKQRGNLKMACEECNQAKGAK